jgi:type IV secretion system protein VirB10
MIRLPWRREPQPDSVPGERAAAIVRGPRSLQSRMSSVLAAGLMASVGAGMLAWYYAEALSHPAAQRRRAQMHVEGAAGEGITLPPFGPVGTAPLERPDPRPGSPSVPTVPQPPAALQSRVDVPADALLESGLARAPGELPPGYGGTAPVSSPRRALDRRLSGEVFARGSRSGLPALGAGDAADGLPVAGSGPAGGARLGPPGSSGGELQTLLRPSVLAATRAQMLPTQHLLLPKGTFIDCTLETAIDSTLPGMTTCVTASDTFSADGTVVLLERGTKLIGETRGEVRQGQARVFVVWTEARTPAGVAVQLDSPGADALGRSGLEGRINRHFWERFGAAALVSTIDGAVQSEVQSSSRGGTVVLDPTASEDVLTEILRGTVNIPPTIRVRNGARIQVLVARDVDFRPVYELETR